jgi:shikimate kinase
MHLKLKGSPIICLVGMMGCGKSTVGQLLAQRLGWKFVDLDEEIERTAGRSISEIFRADGEGRFREMESAALREQCHQAQHGRARVVALGGGAFVNDRNRELLELGGVSVWLDCPLERLWPRVEGMEHRPLAQDRGQFERLYEERLGSYRRADFTVCADTDRPEEIVDAILKLKLF